MSGLTFWIHNSHKMSFVCIKYMWKLKPEVTQFIKSHGMFLRCQTVLVHQSAALQSQPCLLITAFIVRSISVAAATAPYVLQDYIVFLRPLIHRRPVETTLRMDLFQADDYGITWAPLHHTVYSPIWVLLHLLISFICIRAAQETQTETAENCLIYFSKCFHRITVDLQVCGPHDCHQSAAAPVKRSFSGWRRSFYLFSLVSGALRALKAPCRL